MFPFHDFLPREENEKPYYFGLIEQFFRENVLFLSNNCVSSRVSLKDFLKEFNKKFNLKPKLEREQLFLAIEYFKSKEGRFSICKEISFLKEDDCFYGIEMLRYKKMDSFIVVKKSEKCGKCGLFQDLNKQGHCVYCRVDLRLKKMRKEHIVRDFLLENKWAFYSADRVLHDAECGKERPDMVIDFGLVFLVLEIDEFQHEGYVKECERVRVVNLFHALGCQKMLLVRFNPDSFIDKYYRKSKLDLKTRCEVLHLFLEDLRNKLKSVEYVEKMETIQEFKLFFDYNPGDCYTSLDCLISKGILVKSEISDLVKNINGL